MKPLSEQTLYEILEVPPDANAAVIAEAVDRASALYAPGSLATYTLMSPEEEQLLARRIEEARTTLLDPTARARYDERLSAGEPVPAAAPVHAPSEVDPALRAAWPELPPVVPAASADRELDWGEEDEVDLGEPPAATPARPSPAVEARPLPPIIPALAVEPRAEPPPASGPAQPAPQATPLPAPLPESTPSGLRPILLSREVAPAPSTPSPVAPAQPASTAAPGIVPEGTTWSGEVLRKLREARGISLQQISERTKVTRHHIENIEGDRYERLPAAVYLRGILLSIARELRLDGQKVARSYLERVTAATSATTPIQRPR